MRGWYRMPCWNALSEDQQQRLIEHGNLEINYTEAEPDHTGAQVEITTMWDEAPGPRFYCLSCAIGYLNGVTQQQLGHAPVSTQVVTEGGKRGVWIRCKCGWETPGGSDREARYQFEQHAIDAVDS